MTFRFPAAVCAFLLGMVALAAVPPCSAQPSQPAGRASQKEVPYALRTDAFRRLLYEFRFQPLPSFAELEEKPGESLFIMLGNPSCLSKAFFQQGLRSFVEQGGAVLIATDKKTDGAAADSLRELAGVRVTDETLVLRYSAKPDGSIPRYNQSEYCPFVEPLGSSAAAEGSANLLGTLATLIGSGGRPDLFRRGSHPDQPPLLVATNAPSRLRVTGRFIGLPRGIHRLAELPRLCEDDKSKIPSMGFLDREGPLFAVGGTVGKGRVLVLADHSIFINRMMLPHDIGNLEFAANCLHWLRGGAATPMEALNAANSPDALKQLIGQRNQALFWDDGVIRTDFKVPLKKVSLPPTQLSEPAVVAAIDKTIARLEDEDYFNRELFANMDHWPGGRARVFRYALYLATLAAFLFLSYRFVWRLRHRPEVAVPLLADVVSQHEPKASLLDQRRRELLRLGNVWEMGHRLAREFFESAGVALTGPLPSVEMAHGSWRQRWRVRRSVDRLWRLARSDAPVPLSPAALHYRLRELDELKTALANGTIRLI